MPKIAVHGFRDTIRLAGPRDERYFGYQQERGGAWFGGYGSLGELQDPECAFVTAKPDSNRHTEFEVIANVSDVAAL
jgi:hypothetical protein